MVICLYFTSIILFICQFSINGKAEERFLKLKFGMFIHFNRGAFHEKDRV